MFLGNPNFWTAILSFNKLSSLNELKEGKKIIIPQKEVVAVINNFFRD